jgi:antirestriction protein
MNHSPQENATIYSAPKIFVVDLAAYNAGRCHNVWIDCTRPPEVIRQIIANMIDCSPVDRAEEYVIHDTQGFGSYPVAETECIESVCDKAQFIIDTGEVGAKLLWLFLGDLEQARATLEDEIGRYNCYLDYAKETIMQRKDIPEDLIDNGFIDFDAVAVNLHGHNQAHIITLENGDVHLFRK